MSISGASAQLGPQHHPNSGRGREKKIIKPTFVETNQDFNELDSGCPK